MTKTARRLQAGHCLCNVTALVRELTQYDSGIALDLMHGDPESSHLAYRADEIWAVTDWLAGRLNKEGERVTLVGKQAYWSRRGLAGSCVHLDEVMLRIAKTYARRA